MQSSSAAPSVLMDILVMSMVRTYREQACTELQHNSEFHPVGFRRSCTQTPADVEGIAEQQA